MIRQPRHRRDPGPLPDLLQLRRVRDFFRSRDGFAILALFVLAYVVLSLSGCRGGALRTGTATAPTDPYLTALEATNVFAQALLDGKSAADNLHATPAINADGTTTPILDDHSYALVSLGIHALAIEGQTLASLLAARADGPTIAAQMAALTTTVAAQLAPAEVGIKNPQSQREYVVVTNLLNAAVRTLANALIAVTATPYAAPHAALEPHDRSRDYRRHQPGYRSCPV